LALSTRKKNIIIADWKTGSFTKKELEKKHKISFKTLNKLVSGILPTNAEAVDVLCEAEMVKKSIKNPVELKAVENVVKNRIMVDDITCIIANGVKELANKKKAQKVVTVGLGDGVTRTEIVEYDLQAKDYKDMQDTIDKASLTLGVNQRHSNNLTQINNQNQQTQSQQGFIIKVED